jgi:hypothetical protein
MPSRLDILAAINALSWQMMMPRARFVAGSGIMF